MNRDNVEFNKIAAETIKEQIIEVLDKQKQDEAKVQGSIAEKVAMFFVKISAVFIFIQIIAIPTLIFVSSEIMAKIFAVSFVSTILLLVCAMFLDFFIPTSNAQLRTDETKLRKEMSEIILGGEIIAGEVSTQWSEITIDRKTHMSKIMARFSGENNLDIETRSLVLDQAA